MLSIPDMAILGAAALMFFGPEQLPKVARKVGMFVRDVQNTSESFIRELERAADEPVAAYQPLPHDESPAYEPPAYEPPAYEPPAQHPALFEPEFAEVPIHDRPTPHPRGAAPDHELPP